MHLQGNKAGRHNRIRQMHRRHIVNPRPNHIADGLDAKMIPLILAKSSLGLRIILQRNQPAAAGFIINPACPRPLRGVDFHLIAVDPAAAVLRNAVRAYLNAGVQTPVHPKLKFKNKIRIKLLRAQKTVGSIRNGPPYNLAVFHCIKRLAVFLLPAG